MRVYSFAADAGGCGHYRMIWPAEELIRRGYDVRLTRPRERQDMSARIDNDTDEVVEVFPPDDADVIVMQRVTHKYMSRAIPLLRKKGIAVVVDMDDDLSALDQSNPAFFAMHPRNSRVTMKSRAGEHTWHHAQAACDAATLVTVSSEALARVYARHGRFEIIHNAVPDEMLSIEHVDSDTFGYPGAVFTHYRDVDQLGFAVSQLMSEGFKFATVGEDVGIEKMLGLPRGVDVQHGPVSLANWPHTLTKLGIGLAPLVDTKFNQAKSWLKPLELAAVGVPCVMSPRDEYRRIYKLGIGVLARKPGDFYRRTRQLLTDHAMRVDLSQVGRGVAAEHTISAYADHWWDAWTRAYQIQQAS